jgi:hypothetical protein
MLPRVEYSVTVPVSVDAAFQAFQNFDRLLHRGIYSEISWIEGKPWQVGSRLRFVLEKPRSATISAVVASSSPPRAVALLYHALGITAEEHVTFGPDLKGGARIHVSFEFLGASEELSEEATYEVISFLAKDALDTVVDLCRPDRTGSAPNQ